VYEKIFEPSITIFQRIETNNFFNLKFNFMPLFKFIGHFFDNIFKKVKNVAEKEIVVAIKVVNSIKDFDVKHPEVADTLTAIIPGDLDDTLKQKAREALPKILLELNIAKECTELQNTDLFIKCAIEKLAEFEPKIKGLMFHNIAILLTDAFADGKVTVSEITGVIEAVYQELEKHKETESSHEPVQ
jgi:hypothetical protein